MLYTLSDHPSPVSSPLSPAVNCQTLHCKRQQKHQAGRLASLKKVCDVADGAEGEWGTERKGFTGIRAISSVCNTHSIFSFGDDLRIHRQEQVISMRMLNEAQAQEVHMGSSGGVYA